MTTSNDFTNRFTTRSTDKQALGSGFYKQRNHAWACAPESQHLPNFGERARDKCTDGEGAVGPVFRKGHHCGANYAERRCSKAKSGYQNFAKCSCSDY